MQNEIWKVINNYNGYYEVSNFGRVRSITRKIERTDPNDIDKKRLFTYKGKLIPFWITKKGYCRCTLNINGNKKKSFSTPISSKSIFIKPKIISHK